MTPQQINDLAKRTAVAMADHWTSRGLTGPYSNQLDWVAENITAAINEAVELVASNAAKNLYGIAEAYCTERDQLRAENARLQAQIQEYDTALSEFSANEGDDAPWDIMRCEFARRDDEIAELQRQVKELEGDRV